jgi:hypothetical protein
VVSAAPTVASDPAIASAWLAAFALGLAYSRRPEHELVCELREVTASQPWLLGEARGRLASRTVTEPDVCRDAVRLLARAEASSLVAC